MIKLPKLKYWENVVSYFYEDIHWKNQSLDICDWIESEYNVKASRSSNWLEFKSEKDAAFFMLRWN